MIHSNSRLSRRYRRRWKSNSRPPIRRSNLGAFVQTVQAAGSYEASSHKNVDSALYNRKNKKRHRRRSRKDIGSSPSSNLKEPKRIDDSENTDYIPLPSTKLMSAAEKGNKPLTKTAFDDSGNYYSPSVVSLDAPNYSGIRVPKKPKRKRKWLNNEVQENHIAEDSTCLSDNITYEDKYDSCDFTLKDVGSLDEEMDNPLVLQKRAFRNTFRKKLLVLDLNGILCDVVLGSHGSHMPYKKVNRKSVFKRPFLDDFMTFCFERFAVGIWSSRNQKNVAGVINYIMADTKDRLLFYWDQSKCTLTGFNTINDKYKPLVLKELIKLWDKEETTLPWEKGDYSPSNTLLVDDSPYKALCNPPNTAIFPFPYDFRNEGDNFLGPGGALRAYLESIAMVDDVQEHVKQHSFGQLPITCEDEKWSFYKNIIDKNKSISLT